MCKNMRSAEISTVQSPVELSLLGFPEKLWNLVNNPKCEDIVWCADGKCIVIPNTQHFISNILDNPSKQIFKTKNFSSFIRQLNLYGFRKVTEHRGKAAQSNDAQTVSTKCKFKHPFFQIGRRDFLVKVKRQYHSVKKGADKQAALSNVARVESFLHAAASRESSVYSAQHWNPSAALYSASPFYGPVFAPQMPMPTFQFPPAEVLHGGPNGVNAVQGLPCQWEYGPYTSMLPSSPLAQEGKFKSCTSDSRTQVNNLSFPELKPQKSSTWSQRPPAFNDFHLGFPDSSVAQDSFHDDRINGVKTWSIPVPPETKQPFPAQKSTAELTKSVVQTPANRSLNAGKEMAKGSSKITNEEFHSEKRKLGQEDKYSVFSVSDRIASSALNLD